MKWINKTREPKELEEFKAKLKQQKEEGFELSSTYDALKDDPVVNPAVQIALAKDQGYVCCYCMGAIPLKEGEKERPVGSIEHFKPKSIYNGENGKPDLRIEYSNLFFSCKHSKEHCDPKKDKRELCGVFNLIGKQKDITRNLGIRYTSKGVVCSSNDGIHKDIGGDLKKDGTGGYEEGILNLNCQGLINARLGTWKAVSRRITNLGDKDWNKKKTQAVAKDFHTKYSQCKEDGKFHPYYGVIVYQLEKRFRELKSG